MVKQPVASGAEAVAASSGPAGELTVRREATSSSSGPVTSRACPYLSIPSSPQVRCEH